MSELLTISARQPLDLGLSPFPACRRMHFHRRETEALLRNAVWIRHSCLRNSVSQIECRGTRLDLPKNNDERLCKRLQSEQHVRGLFKLALWP
jgi:hypothetical protein